MTIYAALTYPKIIQLFYGYVHSTFHHQKNFQSEKLSKSLFHNSYFIVLQNRKSVSNNF